MMKITTITIKAIGTAIAIVIGAICSLLSLRCHSVLLVDDNVLDTVVAVSFVFVFALIIELIF